MYKAIAQLRHRHDRLIIGGNIGKNTLTQPSQVAADYLKMFRNLYQYVDYFSINVCCDNCADGSVSHNKAHLMNILQPLFDFRRGQNQYRPILLKISPDLSNEDIDTMTDIMMDTPLDGIVATNAMVKPTGMKTDGDELKKAGYGVYLLSNASYRQHEYWPRVPGSQYFDGTLISADVKLVKPLSLIHISEPTRPY